MGSLQRVMSRKQTVLLGTTCQYDLGGAWNVTLKCGEPQRGLKQEITDNMVTLEGVRLEARGAARLIATKQIAEEDRRNGLGALGRGSGGGYGPSIWSLMMRGLREGSDSQTCWFLAGIWGYGKALHDTGNTGGQVGLEQMGAEQGGQ